MIGELGRDLARVPARPDVVVVGARVAGSATAYWLARAGFEVVIVDRAGPPADTVSTHALMRSGVLQLKRMGVLNDIIAAGTPSVARVGLVFGEERLDFPVADEYGVDAYYAPRRTVLDTVLLEAAIEAGATFVSGTVTGVSRDADGRANGVETREYGTIRSRWTIGADGTNSRIGRSVDAPVELSSPATNTIVYSYFSAVDYAGYEFRFLHHRNVGLIPTNAGLTLAFVGGPLREAPHESEGYLFSTLRQVAPDLAELVQGGRRESRFHRANGIPNLLRMPMGAGWALVGDAGFTEDPIAAHGITDALRDAELCATAVATALDDPNLERDAASEYRSTRNRFARRLLDATVPLARFEWDGAEASRLLRVIGDVSEEECQLMVGRDGALAPVGGVSVSGSYAGLVSH